MTAHLRPTFGYHCDVILDDESHVGPYVSSRQYVRLPDDSHEELFKQQGLCIGDLIMYLISVNHGSQYNIVLSKQKLKRMKTVYYDEAFCFRYLLYCPKDNHIRQYITLVDHE
jgi:hypothetical protein